MTRRSPMAATIAELGRRVFCVPGGFRLAQALQEGVTTRRAGPSSWRARLSRRRGHHRRRSIPYRPSLLLSRKPSRLDSGSRTMRNPLFISPFIPPPRSESKLANDIDSQGHSLGQAKAVQINGRGGFSVKSYCAISARRLRLSTWKTLFFQRITFISESFRRVLLVWTSDIPSASATCC
jgi:hypothetical protein